MTPGSNGFPSNPGASEERIEPDPNTTNPGKVLCPANERRDYLINT